MKTTIPPQQDIAGILDGSITAWRDGVDLKTVRWDCKVPGNPGHKFFPMTQSAPYQVGDIVLGLEEWKIYMTGGYGDVHFYKVVYRDGSKYKFKSTVLYPLHTPWQPADTMPHEFSRVKMEITSVSVEKDDGEWNFVYNFKLLKNEN